MRAEGSWARERWATEWRILNDVTGSVLCKQRHESFLHGIPLTIATTTTSLHFNQLRLTGDHASELPRGPYIARVVLPLALLVRGTRRRAVVTAVSTASATLIKVNEIRIKR